MNEEKKDVTADAVNEAIGSIDEPTKTEAQKVEEAGLAIYEAITTALDGLKKDENLSESLVVLAQADEKIRKFIDGTIDDIEEITAKIVGQGMGKIVPELEQPGPTFFKK